MPVNESDIVDLMELAGELTGQLLEENQQYEKQAASEQARLNETVNELVKLGVIMDRPEHREALQNNLSAPGGMHRALINACRHVAMQKQALAEQERQRVKKAALEPGEAVGRNSDGQSSTEEIEALIKAAEAGMAPYRGDRGRTSQMRAGDALLARRHGIL